MQIARYVRSVAAKLYCGVTRLLPPKLASRLDAMRPSMTTSWGGPLNGQAQRCASVRELARSFALGRVIETGTYRGTSTVFFADVFGVPVSTVESQPRFFYYSQRRFASRASVETVLGDSRQFLRELANRPGVTEETVFVYLDAHWERDLPLREELEIVAAGWRRAVVMIDDFEVPGDAGYQFDDYGYGERLTADYLPTDRLDGWGLYYPAVSSELESGAKRGACVLISPELLGLKPQFTTLRLDGVLSSTT